MISTDESIRRLERALELDPHDRGTRLALGAAKFRIGIWDEIVAFWWIHEKKIPEDRILMAARLDYGLAELIATGRKLNWSDWEDRKEALNDLTSRESCCLASDFAEAVLPVFEALYPTDKRPRWAIEAARTWAYDPTEANQRLASSADRDSLRAARIANADRDADSDKAYRAAMAAKAAAEAAHAASAYEPGTIGLAAWASHTAAAAAADCPATLDAQRLRCIDYLLRFPGTPADLLGPHG